MATKGFVAAKVTKLPKDSTATHLLKLAALAQGKQGGKVRGLRVKEIESGYLVEVRE